MIDWKKTVLCTEGTLVYLFSYDSRVLFIHWPQAIITLKALTRTLVIVITMYSFTLGELGNREVKRMTERRAQSSGRARMEASSIALHFILYQNLAVESRGPNSLLLLLKVWALCPFLSYVAKYCNVSLWQMKPRDWDCPVFQKQEVILWLNLKMINLRI